MTPIFPPLLDSTQPELRPGAQGIARVAVRDERSQLVVTFCRPIDRNRHSYALDPRSYSLSGGQRVFPKVQQAMLYEEWEEVRNRDRDSDRDRDGGQSRGGDRDRDRDEDRDRDRDDVPPELRGRRVVLQLDRGGDRSPYTLTVSGPDVDPFFGRHPVRFKLDSDDPFDSVPPAPPPTPVPEAHVTIDYLAKDYASFRQALLDFIPTRLPAWTERSEADIGIMLLELFAATADNLSYMQDRLANEVYLDTATQRRSVAGHLALLGYQMDEGAAAHTWLHFEVNATATLPENPGLRVSTEKSSFGDAVIVFETHGATTLRPDHNRLTIYDWDTPDARLPDAALSAPLVGRLEHLHAGDYLLFADDQAGQYDVIRLTEEPEFIAKGSIGGRPHPDLTVVRWSAATPLHDAYSARGAVVRGNMVLATHGETVSETLRPGQSGASTPPAPLASSQPQRTPRLRLSLGQAPLAHLDSATLGLAAPATRQPAAPQLALGGFSAAAPRSVSTLEVQVAGQSWQEQPTLLYSGSNDPVYRVEIDDQGTATVVFGNGQFGRRPDDAAEIIATYRIGGGSAGNVGANTLTVPQPRPERHEDISWLDTSVPTPVSNPVAAGGGRDLESRDHARRFGPDVMRKPLVAVGPPDYPTALQDFTDATGQPLVARANAQIHWTGSWLTTTVTAEPATGQALSPDLHAALGAFLDTRRPSGYDVLVTAAAYLPIDLTVEFYTAPGSRPSDVQQALAQALSNTDLPGGGRGFFHPSNVAIGENLSVSQLFAAITAVPGVQSAQITTLASAGAPQPDLETGRNLRQGYLKVGSDQIIRLDNDPSAPENGILTIVSKGLAR